MVDYNLDLKITLTTALGIFIAFAILVIIFFTNTPLAGVMVALAPFALVSILPVWTLIGKR